MGTSLALGGLGGTGARDELGFLQPGEQVVELLAGRKKGYPGRGTNIEGIKFDLKKSTQQAAGTVGLDTQKSGQS